MALRAGQKHSKDEIEAALRVVDDVVEATALHLDQSIEPMRRGFIKRFPVTFALLVTLGVTATILGLEQILDGIPYVHDRPWLLFIGGMTILAVTGSLYKKLG
jgi:hypothetical protein